MQYLNDVETAKRITRETVKVFHAHGVTTLVESNISRESDLLLLNELISKQHLEIEESHLDKEVKVISKQGVSNGTDIKLESPTPESPSAINMKKRRLEASPKS